MSRKVRNVKKEREKRGKREKKKCKSFEVSKLQTWTVHLRDITKQFTNDD